MSGCCSGDGYAFAPSWIKEEGQGSRDKAHEAMSDYMEVYDYKPETFAGIKYAFTSKSFRIIQRTSDPTTFKYLDQN